MGLSGLPESPFAGATDAAQTSPSLTESGFDGGKAVALKSIFQHPAP